jgi:hypothetical protein
VQKVLDKRVTRNEAFGLSILYDGVRIPSNIPRIKRISVKVHMNILQLISLFLDLYSSRI